MKRGTFIVFEGIDGSGKSSQAKELYNYLCTKEGKKLLGGRGVYLTGEPTKNTIPQIQLALSGTIQISPITLQLLMSADRAEHVIKEIEPRLKQGITVISDRYFFSTLAYGALSIGNDALHYETSATRLVRGMNRVVLGAVRRGNIRAHNAVDEFRNAKMDWLWEINKHFPMPDIVFLTDVPPRVAVERIRTRKEHITVFEASKKLARIRKNYGILEKKFKNIIRIDSNRDVKAIQQDIVEIVKHRIA